MIARLRTNRDSSFPSRSLLSRFFRNVRPARSLLELCAGSATCIFERTPWLVDALRTGSFSEDGYKARRGDDDEDDHDDAVPGFNLCAPRPKALLVLAGYDGRDVTRLKQRIL